MPTFLPIRYLISFRYRKMKISLFPLIFFSFISSLGIIVDEWTASESRKHMPLQTRIFDIIENPETSVYAWGFGMFSLSVTWFSIFCACFDTLPGKLPLKIRRKTKKIIIIKSSVSYGDNDILLMMFVCLSQCVSLSVSTIQEPTKITTSYQLHTPTHR